MRNASSALIALLNSGSEFVVADCLTFILADGTIVRMTNAGVDVTVVSQYDNASHVFPSGLPFTRGETRVVIGTEVGTLQVTLSPDPAVHTLEGVPWPAAVRAGALDGAEVLLEKVISAAWGDTSAGTLILFWGRAGSPVASRSTITLTVNSAMVLLQAQMPINVYQPGCLHALFDAGCELSQGTFTVTGTAHTGTTASSIVTGLSFAATYYDLGQVVFTSGANAGLSRSVRSSASGAVIPIVAFPFTPAVGDAFSLIPGCDKKQATCDTKFSNLLHFRGYPFVPVPESAR